MGTRVNFTPLYGVYSEGPFSYLLEVDGFRFLLDCGWTDTFQPSVISQLESIIPTLDAVLLSHADMAHLGALPYMVGKLGLTAPVYCTLPVRRMGHFLMSEHFYSRQAVSNFDLFSLDDIENAFDNTIQLKYCQQQQLTGKGEGITITPYGAGHLLGGTVWKISKESEDILYAVDYNHRKERHLNGTVLLTDAFVRPALLITDSLNALQPQPPRRLKEDFQELILKVLREGGNVLLPVEPVGRVLELFLLLDEFWEEKKLAYPLALLSRTAVSVVEFAKSSLEWMSDRISKDFEMHRESPYALKKVQLLRKREQLDALEGPKVVMACMVSMEAGEARQLFTEWAGDPRNLVIFTESPQKDTLAWHLQHLDGHSFVPLSLSRKVPLEGDDLQAFKAETRRKHQELHRSGSLRSGGSSGGSGMPTGVAEADGAAGRETADTAPSSVDAEPEPMETSATQLEDTPTLKRPILVDGFEFNGRRPAPMFPFEDMRGKWAEYGQEIDPEDYKLEEPEVIDLTVSKKMRRSDEDIDDIIWRPSRIDTWDVKIDVKCQIRSLLFEGRVDGKSLKKIVEHLAPLKLVVIGGPAKPTAELVHYCSTHVAGVRVAAPKAMEAVDLSSDTSAYKAKLTEELMHSCMMRKLGDYEIAWVDCRIGSSEGDDKPPPLLPLPPGDIGPHKAVFVGEVKLADFRQLLASKGVQSEFVGGALRCGEHVTVKKTTGVNQQFIIEGALSEEYYKIREMLYSQFYIL